MGNSYYSDYYQQNEDDIKLIKEYDGISYLRLRKALIPLFNLLYHPKIYGKENIPENGPIILTGNHRSIIDPLFACISTKRVVHFMAKKELHEAFYGKFFELAQTIPVDREHKDSTSMKTALRLLAINRAIGIMPEGKVNRTTQPLLPLRYGAVSLAKKTNALIVPFAISGSYKLFRYDMSVRFGKPLDISDIELTEANDILYQNILTLINQQE